MTEILTRCGFRCDLCLAYKPNIEKHPENRQTISDGWFQYFGFRIPPEDITCDGCMEENPKLLDKDCPIRPCVLEKGFDNCAQCDDYICEKLQQRIVVYEDVAQRMAQDIPGEDRARFIQPYENKTRLDALRVNREL